MTKDYWLEDEITAKINELTKDVAQYKKHVATWRGNRHFSKRTNDKDIVNVLKTLEWFWYQQYSRRNVKKEFKKVKIATDDDDRLLDSSTAEGQCKAGWSGMTCTTLPTDMSASVTWNRNGKCFTFSSFIVPSVMRGETHHTSDKSKHCRAL